MQLELKLVPGETLRHFMARLEESTPYTVVMYAEAERHLEWLLRHKPASDEEKAELLTRAAEYALASQVSLSRAVYIVGQEVKALDINGRRRSWIRAILRRPVGGGPGGGTPACLP